MKENAEIANALERIADLLEIDGADSFRINSYRKASRSVAEAVDEAADLSKQARLTELPGVGKGLSAHIKEFVDTGRILLLDELSGKFPSGLVELLGIPGMGPKKVALVHQMLSVGSLDDLKRVVASGELASLKGMGPALVKKIEEGITFHESRAGRIPLGVALPTAEEIVGRLSRMAGVQRVAIAGSLRRGRETIGDVDLVCQADDGEAVLERFASSPEVRKVLGRGPTKCSVLLATKHSTDLQVDVRVVAAESFGAALQYFTGSKEHNIRVREIAASKGYRLNEYGLFQEERIVAGADEREIYDRLGLTMAPPELREDRGEFAPSFVAPDLVELSDVRGDLHMHSVASDGRNTVTEMALAAKELGLQYIAICDHSKSSTIANGLSIERMEKHIAEIRALQPTIPGVSVLVGCECDILSDGMLDYPDEILAQCDWVVASIHSGISGAAAGRMNPTDRTLAAMRNRYVSIIGHPTGRLIHRRAPMAIDMGAIVKFAAQSQTLLEINANWHRLDLKDIHIRQAIEAGVMLAINTDAHHADDLALMRYGVITARRGGATPNHIANCTSIAGLRKIVDRKRQAT